tara:strand:- start:344 stop:1093 length:750 start_codon:yes stop_codon:yes gene_type:complete
MIISSVNKFIFVANPKCGSSSLRYILSPHADVISTRITSAEEKTRQKISPHQCAFKIKKSIEKVLAEDPLKDDSSPIGEYEPEKALGWDDYYRFSTIRNPYKKMVSWYFFLRPDKDFNMINHIEYDRHSAFHHHFNDFIDYLASHIENSLPHYEFMFMDWSNGEDLMHDVFKLEEINETFPSKFKEKTGITMRTPLPNWSPNGQGPAKEDPHNVKFKGNPYDLYNDSSKQYIETNFKTDLNKFNYEFGQ